MKNRIEGGRTGRCRFFSGSVNPNSIRLKQGDFPNGLARIVFNSRL